MRRPQSNELYRRIAGSKKKSQQVVAAAGSGKTRLLVEVLAIRLAEGISDPLKEEIIVFTFTNNAADELVVRLTAKLDKIGRRAAMARIFIGTIHSWCSKFLKDTGVLANTKVVDELEQSQILLRVYPILGLKNLYNGKNQFDRIDQFLADLELFNNELLDLEVDEIPNNVRLATENYQKFMQSQRLLDFGSLIREATIRVARRSNNAKPFQVYVDEYQDVNPSQVKLFQAMLNSHPNSRLFAVGDPRQAIYQWRGGDVGRTFSFSHDFPDSETHELSTNHRSRTGIVEFANVIAGDMKFPRGSKIGDMEVSSTREDDRFSVVSDVGTLPNEEGVVQIVRGLLGQGISPGDIAILMRSVLSYGQGLMDRFDSEGISYYSPNRNSGTYFVQEFLLSIVDLVRIIEEPPNPGNQQEERELEQQIKDSLQKIARHTGEKTPSKIHLAVADWHRELTKDRNKPRNERYNFRGQLFDFCESLDFKISTKNVEIQEGFAAITQIMKAIEEAYRRRYLQGYHVRSSPYDVFVHNLRWQLENQLERWAEAGMNVSRSNAITISTVHAAKGLEWPVVIIPYLWTGRFPVRNSSHGTSFSDKIAARYGTTLEDERRLWYTAATRARDRLHFFSKSDSHPSPSPFAYPERIGKIVGTIAAATHGIDQGNLSEIEHYDKPRYFSVAVTDFLLLLECPYEFYLRKIAGIDVPVGEELGAGNIMHRVIQRIAQGESEAQLEDMVREEVYLPLGEVEHEKKVRISVKAKVKRLIKSGILKSINNTEYGFSFKIGDMVVSGIVDATRPEGKLVGLVDWKYSIREEFEPRYNNQLVVYAHGLRYCGIDVRDALLYDLSAKGAPAKIEVDVSPLKADALVSRAADAFGRLAKDDPFTTPSLASCRACDVSQICPDSLMKKTVRQR